MKPYLSIIKDSFRAALASRVLYVLLVCITLILLLLAPIWVKEELAWEIQPEQHVRNPAGLVKRLAEAGPTEDEPLVHQVWVKMSDEVKEEIKRFYDFDRAREASENPGQDETFGETGALARESMRENVVQDLNRIIRTDDLYEPQLFDSRVLPDEAQAFIDQGVDSLSEQQKRRLNRLLMEIALGPFIRQSATSALTISYLAYSPDFLKVNQTRPELKKLISNWLPWIMDKFVLSAGLLVAVLVTASLIPEMLQSNSLSLLLSKPISRWGLLLSKFLGGCAFVAILASYLFIGLWFLLGLRINYWDSAILLSIPVYIFAFAIYFSVSTLVGIVFRNTIVSILLTFVFWGLCWAVGTAFNAFDSGMSSWEIVNVLEAEDEIFQVDDIGMSYQWNGKENVWEPALVEESMQYFSTALRTTYFFGAVPDLPSPVGPVYDPLHDVVLIGQIDFQRQDTIDRRKLIVSSEENNWEVGQAGYLPRGIEELQTTPALGVVAISGTGEFYRLPVDPLKAAREAGAEPGKETKTDDPETSSPATPESTSDEKNPQAESPDSQANNAASTDADATSDSKAEVQSVSQQTPQVNLDSKKSSRQKLDLFEAIGPKIRTSVAGSEYVDLNSTTNEIAIYRRGTIHLYQPKDGTYVATQNIKPELDIDTSMSAWIQYRGQTILLALGNGELITIDRPSLKELNTYTPSTRTAIRSVHGSPDGRWFVVVYRNGELWILDTESPDHMRQAPIRGQGNISMAKFTQDSQLWVGDRTDRLTLYDPPQWTQSEVYAPHGNVLFNIYRYGVYPLYRVFPKPGEFYKLVSHLSETGGTQYDRNIDLTTQPEPEHPWEPFRSGLYFMIVVLAIACWIFQRQDY